MKSSLLQTKLLLEVAKFNALKMLAYPWELVAFFIQRFIGLSFLAIFWFAVAQSSSTVLDFRHLIAYFLISSAVRDLTFSYETKFGREIMRMVKKGEISNYLIKPVPSIPFLFSAFAGQTWMALLYSAVAMIAGLIILPPTGMINFFSFFVFLILAFFVSISFNLFVAILSFYVVEANGIRNMFNHIIRILSGALIPLTLFPEVLRNITLLSPFPLLAFTPTYVLQNTLPWQDITQLFLVSSAWAIGLSLIASFLWKKALKKYEGVGI
ncbi:MAG: ABC-2 family transporter protein [Candidatus Parcubacteria bacterium]|nr:ABC-2 family transporter protein [Candidatus Parcubacteria bacterium]